MGEDTKPETLERKSKSISKEQVLEQLATTQTTINDQLDFQPDAKTKMLLMEFCVSVTNNELKRSDITVEDIQGLYAIHLINSNVKNSLWEEVSRVGDKMLYLQKQALDNAVPEQMLVSEYDKRLEREGRGKEQLKAIDKTSQSSLSSEIQGTLDQIRETVSKFQQKVQPEARGSNIPKTREVRRTTKPTNELKP
jgi:hypothetical protein